MKEKVKLCFLIAEKAKEFIWNEEAKSLVESAIGKCQEWVDGKHIAPEELCDYLDNEEKGFTIFQERETDETQIAAWNCIIDAVAFICKSAYLEADIEYLPEPIELVDDTTIDHMVQSFSLCASTNECPNIYNME